MPMPASQPGGSDLKAGMQQAREHHVPSGARQGVLARCLMRSGPHCRHRQALRMGRCEESGALHPHVGAPTGHDAPPRTLKDTGLWQAGGAA